MRRVAVAAAAAACTSAAPTYVWDTAWAPTFPAGANVTRLTATAFVGSRLHVLERGTTTDFTGRVWVVDPSSGNVLGSWGQNVVVSAHGMTSEQGSSPSASVWITDPGDATIKVFEGSGTAFVLKRTYGVANSRGQGLSPLQFDQVADVALPSTNQSVFYVVDGDGGANNRALVVERASGTVVWASSDTPGNGPGQFTTPHSIAIHEASGLVFIADRSNNRTQVFDAASMTFLGQWTCVQPGQPWAIRIDQTRGVLFLADGTLGRLLVFDLSAAQPKTVPPCSPIQTLVIPPAAAHLHEMAVNPATGDVFIAQVGTPTGVVRIARQQS